LIPPPQTCGKVERFDQTVKKYLDQQDPPETIEELQVLLDRFVAYYNDVRPHRGINRKTPRSAYEARVKARPSKPGIFIEGYRVRHDKVDKAGKVTLRYKGRLRHLGVGRPHKGERVILLVAGPEVRVLSEEGELIGEVTIDPNRGYQPLK
jgi:hypothetical protein